MKLLNRFKYTFNSIMDDITPAEYVIHWVIRILMFYGAFHLYDQSQVVMYWVNMAALFGMSIVRFIAPKKTFLARLSFRIQHVVTFFEFIGGFVGKVSFIYAYSIVPKYDRVLHFLSGAGVVIVGFYIYKAIVSKEEDRSLQSPVLASFCSFSFSFAVMVFWEIVEFFGDYLFGSQCQGWYYQPGENDIFFKIFKKAADPGQFPVWDTMMDMIDATIMTVIASTVLFFVLTALKKKKDEKEALKPSNEKEPVTATAK